MKEEDLLVVNVASVCDRVVASGHLSCCERFSLDVVYLLTQLSGRFVVVVVAIVYGSTERMVFSCVH